MRVYQIMEADPLPDFTLPDITSSGPSSPIPYAKKPGPGGSVIVTFPDGSEETFKNDKLADKAITKDKELVSQAQKQKGKERIANRQADVSKAKIGARTAKLSAREANTKLKKLLSHVRKLDNEIARGFFRKGGVLGTFLQFGMSAKALLRYAILKEAKEKGHPVTRDQLLAAAQDFRDEVMGGIISAIANVVLITKLLSQTVRFVPGYGWVVSAIAFMSGAAIQFVATQIFIKSDLGMKLIDMVWNGIDFGTSLYGGKSLEAVLADLANDSGATDEIMGLLDELGLAEIVESSEKPVYEERLGKVDADKKQVLSDLKSELGKTDPEIQANIISAIKKSKAKRS